jgi:hypothetical protein
MLPTTQKAPDFVGGLLLRDVANGIFGFKSRSNFLGPPTPVGGAPPKIVLAFDLRVN